MRKSDLITGLIWLILSALIIVNAFELELGGLSAPGPGMLPMLTSVPMGLLSLLLISEAIFAGRNKQVAKTIWQRDIRWRRMVSIVFSLIVYALLLEKLGYLLCTFLLMTFLFKGDKSQKWLKSCILSVVSVLISYAVFASLLRCQLPEGILENVLGGIVR